LKQREISTIAMIEELNELRDAIRQALENLDTGEKNVRRFAVVA
jgi:hypothetical protein